MRHPRAMGRRLTAKQAAIDAAQRIKDSTKPRRFVGRVSSVVGRETAGTVSVVAYAVSPYALTVQVRENVDLAADDIIWIREDQGAQTTYVFDGFVKGGGTGNNAADAPIPWTQTPGVISPPSSDLTIAASSGQTTIVGGAGDTTSFPGTISGISLNELDDVNAGTPSDNDALTWDTGTSRWINEALSAGWPFTGEYLSVSTSDADAEYPTIAAAIAAAGAGDTILLSSESIGCVNQTLPDGVHLGCLGPSAAILTNSTNAITLNVGDGSVVFNIEVRNTYAAAAVYGVNMPTTTDTARFYNVTSTPDNSGGAGNATAFYVGGSSELVDCRGITSAAAYGYAFVGAGAGDKRIQGGYFDGSGVSGGDDINNQAGTTTLIDPVLENDKIDTLLGSSGTRGGWYATDGEHRDDTQKVTNTSGGTVAAGALGYIDSAGEFKTTTTAYSYVDWAVVLVGGANNASIWVTNQGHRTVTLNGNCSAGDLLYTSTTAGQGTTETYPRAELCGVALTANASGAGGTAEFRLLCNTQRIGASSSNNIIYVASHDDTDFVATIATLPGGAVLTYNAPSSGNENTIDPQSATELGKLVLADTTRGDDALIDDVTTGTNTITLTANVPGTWQVGDTITARSQTTTFGSPPPYFFEVDLSSADNDAIPILARALVMDVGAYDSGGTSEYLLLHPYETYASSKEKTNRVQEAAVWNYRQMEVGLFQRRFCYMASASGAATKRSIFRLVAYDLAVP